MMRRVLFWASLSGGLVWALVALAQVSTGKLSVKGPLPQAAAQSLLASRNATFNACAEAARKSGASLSGTLVLEWSVNADGKVTRISKSSRSTVGAGPFAECVIGAIRGLTFAKSSGESTLTYSVSLSEPPRQPADTKKVEKDEDKSHRRPAKNRIKAAEPSHTAEAEAGSGRLELDGVGTRSSRGSGKGGGAVRGEEVAMPPAASPVELGEPAGSSRPRRDTALAGDDFERPAERVRSSRSAPALRAGRHDDNKQYNRFVEFFKQHQRLIPFPLDVSERIVVRTLDKNGKSLHNCKIEVAGGDGTKLAQTITYADGSTHFFPSAASKSLRDYTVAATCGKLGKNGQLSRDGLRNVDLTFDVAREVPTRVPLDIAILLDTTGSMGGQLERLKQTIQAIHLQISELPTKPDLRFGLIAYRDRGDDYVTQVTQFTTDVKAFQRVIDRLEADGGGDTPEDIQEALHDALKKLDWRGGAVRLGFVIADAIPHTDYPDQKYTYRDAMRDSLNRGIKWSMVGAGGLPLNGELIFRQIAQYTMGEYVFITPSDVQRDSDGTAVEASHHVGTNYAVENLDQAIVRIVRRELSHLTDTPRDFDYTIVATGTKATPRDKILAPAVQEVLRQLTDYSAIRLDGKTPVAVVPVDTPDASYKAVAEYLSDQMILNASRRAEFKVVERDLRALAQEQKIQLSDLFEVTKTAQFGKLLGAELLIVSRLSVRGETGELYAKLVRVETGEILSAAKVEFKGGVLAGS